MEHGSAKRLAIARIFAAAGSLDDTIAACSDARRSSQEALRVLDVVERLVRADSIAPDDIALAISQAKSHLERNDTALKYASASAEAVAKTMRFDAA